MSSRAVLAPGLIVLFLFQPAAAQEQVETAPFEQVLTRPGVDQVVLGTTFRFAADFNARPEASRRGARIVGVAESFFRALSPQIYPLHGPAGIPQAREQLTKRFQAFLQGYVDHLIDRQVRDIELRQSEAIDQYLSQAGATNRCNQIPCRRPPCCRDCSAPAGTPPTCPS